MFCNTYTQELTILRHRADTIGLVIAFRLLQGGAGSVGATVVGGSLADIWVSAERGPKMGGFALCAVVGTVSRHYPFH